MITLSVVCRGTICMNEGENLRMEIQEIPPARYDPDEKWVVEYIEQFGTDPSFF